MSTRVREKSRSDMKVWCASDMHAPESWGEDRWNTFAGAVIAADDAPRLAGQGGRKVFNVVLEDSTGLICIAAWNHHAEELSSITTQLENAQNQTGTDYCLQMDVFSISQMRGSSRELCPIGSMQTLAGSSVKRIQGVSSSSRDAAVVDSSFGTQFALVKASEVRTPRPSRSSGSRIGIGGITEGITNFETLRQLHPPFRVNLAGVIAEVSALQPTTSGSSKMVRNVVLSDPNGNQVTIKQLGTAT